MKSFCFQDNKCQMPEGLFSCFSISVFSDQYVALRLHIQSFLGLKNKISKPALVNEVQFYLVCPVVIVQFTMLPALSCTGKWCSNITCMHLYA